LLLLRYRLSIRERFYLTRRALLNPARSAWQHLWLHGDDRSLICTTGFDRYAFVRLLGPFAAHLNLSARGRPPSLDAAGQLGLVLNYLNSKMGGKTLCMVFGITPAVLSRFIKAGLRALLGALRDLPEARIKFPNVAQMRNFADMVEEYEPQIRNCFGFVDGLSLAVEEPADPEKQNAQYTAFYSACRINNVMLFTPDGCIAAALLNAPGSWHDSQVARPLWMALADPVRTPNPFCIVGDIGFQLESMAHKVKTPRKENEFSSHPATRARQERVQQYIVRVRQAAEWGMRQLQGSFGRLKTELPADDQKRLLLLRVIAHLYNFRVRVIGVNQIRTVYLKPLEVDAQDDRVKRYYALEAGVDFSDTD